MNYQGKYMKPASIEKKLKELPPEMQQEVVDFIDFLIMRKEKSIHSGENSFNFKWANGLSELKEKYSSVDLQRKSMDWR